MKVLAEDAKADRFLSVTSAKPSASSALKLYRADAKSYAMFSTHGLERKSILVADSNPASALRRRVLATCHPSSTKQIALRTSASTQPKWTAHRRGASL